MSECPGCKQDCRSREDCLRNRLAAQAEELDRVKAERDSALAMIQDYRARLRWALGLIADYMSGKVAPKDQTMFIETRKAIEKSPASALRALRASILEEAAKVADLCTMNGIPIEARMTMTDREIAAANEAELIARNIRALADGQQGKGAV